MNVDPSSFTRIFKVVGPVYGAMIAMFWLLGEFIIRMYNINLDHAIKDSFPTQFQITFYFIMALFAAVFILLVATYQSMAIEHSSNKQPPKSRKRNQGPGASA